MDAEEFKLIANIHPRDLKTAWKLCEMIEGALIEHPELAKYLS